MKFSVVIIATLFEPVDVVIVTFAELSTAVKPYPGFVITADTITPPPFVTTDAVAPPPDSGEAIEIVSEFEKLFWTATFPETVSDTIGPVPALRNTQPA